VAAKLIIVEVTELLSWQKLRKMRHNVLYKARSDGGRVYTVGFF